MNTEYGFTNIDLLPVNEKTPESYTNLPIIGQTLNTPPPNCFNKRKGTPVLLSDLMQRGMNEAVVRFNYIHQAGLYINQDTCKASLLGFAAIALFPELLKTTNDKDGIAYLTKARMQFAAITASWNWDFVCSTSNHFSIRSRECGISLKGTEIITHLEDTDMIQPYTIISLLREKGK